MGEEYQAYGGISSIWGKNIKFTGKNIKFTGKNIKFGVRISSIYKGEEYQVCREEYQVCGEEYQV